MAKIVKKAAAGPALNMETIRQEIKNKQGEKLVCELNISDSKTNKPTVLILHALTGKKENSTINFIAKNLPNKGYNTLQFDFSGHGESQGKLEDANVTKQLDDINAVLEQIKQVDISRIILIGNSFSVITALAFAKNNKTIAGLILISGRAHYLKYIETLEKVGDKYRLFGEALADKSFVKDYKLYDPIASIKSVTCPVLIIHGDKDDVIPKEDAELLFKSSPSSKDLLIVHGAGHRFTEIEQKQNALDRIIHFLNANNKD
ncbi:MAG: alpha/beta hydrolase [Nanoarchaeota archaeon]|nr:alpha/beta hydrolase [Nanoarchaeota archaeon]